MVGIWASKEHTRSPKNFSRIVMTSSDLLSSLNFNQTEQPVDFVLTVFLKYVRKGGPDSFNA